MSLQDELYELAEENVRNHFTYLEAENHNCKYNTNRDLDQVVKDFMESEQFNVMDWVGDVE